MQIQEDKPYDDINITPMLDLAYVLLVIFILMCTASIQGAKVNLPKASKTQSPVKKQTLAINISGDGKITLNTFSVGSLQELEQKLNVAHSTAADSPVVIKGDSKAPYQAVSDVLGVVNRVGFTQVGLATQASKK